MADAKARDLLNSVKGPLPEAVRKLEAASRALPADTDFHFYCNFPQFKRPLYDVTASMSTLLSRIGTARELRTEVAGFVDEPDEVYDWLIALQDDLLEKVDGALDEFQKARNERKRRKGPDFDEVCLDRRKKGKTLSFRDSSLEETQKLVKIAKRGNDAKGSVPTYIKSIPRPQDKFDVEVDNSNTPFQHPTKVAVVSLDGGVGKPIPVTSIATGQDGEKAHIAKEATGSASTSVSEGFTSFQLNQLERLDNYAQKLKLRNAAHPLEDELRSLEYKDGLLLEVEPQEPLPLAATPCTFVDTLPALKDLAVKLSTAQEIAVDLENHHYRTFQGFVCIMQVSTRTEDFIIDTLALRSQIGPCLGGIFSSSGIKKVMHGADRDVVWLQRDFGIYLCNLFDTGQATRVLEFPSFGLAFLLQHFCNITADKRYQLADWRLRPLTPDMLRYAREDTHYLLYIHDKLKQLLIAGRAEKSADPLLQVFEGSREVCFKLYEKDLLSDNSHLQLYGLMDRRLRPVQMGVLAELYAWRDQVARKEDESTGFVCPNKLLIQLAEQMPQNPQELQKLTKGVRSLVHQQPGTILSIIRTTKETFLSKMSVVDVEEGEISNTPLGPDLTLQTQGQEGRSSEGQEVDENLSSEGGQKGGAMGSGADVNLASTTDSSLEALLHEQAAGAQTTLPEEVSVERRVIPGAAIVRRAMVSSLFGTRSRASVSSRSVQVSEANHQNPRNNSALESCNVLPSHSSNLPAEVNKVDDKTFSPAEGTSHSCRQTGGDIPVSEQSIECQTLAMQSQSEDSDSLVLCATTDLVYPEALPVLSSDNPARSGMLSDGLKATMLIPGVLSVKEKAPEPLLAALPVSVELDCSAQEPLNQESIEIITPESLNSAAVDCNGDIDATQDNLRSPARQMQVQPAVNMCPQATVECSDVASTRLEQSSLKLGPENAATRGFASLLGRPPKNKCKPNYTENDVELMEGRRKAEQIKSSVTLPFHGSVMHVADTKDARSDSQAAVRDMSSMTVLEKLGVKSRDKAKLPVKEPREWGEVVSFEAGDDGGVEIVNEDQQMLTEDKREKQGRRWAGGVPEIRQPAGTGSPFPTPLSAVRRILRQGNTEADVQKRDKNCLPRFDKDSRKKRKTGPTATQVPCSGRSLTSKSETKRKRKSSFQQGSVVPVKGGVEIPFDYEAAKKELGFELELNRNRTDDLSNGKSNRKKNKPNPRPSAPNVFDPYRKTMREPKAEGIRPGSRRQVFPQSGNRSAIFK